MATNKARRATDELDALYEERLENFLREKLGFSEEAIRKSRPRKKQRSDKEIR